MYVRLRLGAIAVVMMVIAIEVKKKTLIIKADWRSMRTWTELEMSSVTRQCYNNISKLTTNYPRPITMLHRPPVTFIAQSSRMSRPHTSWIGCFVRGRTRSVPSTASWLPRSGLTTFAPPLDAANQVSQLSTPSSTVSESLVTSSSPPDSLFEEFSAEYANLRVTDRAQKPFNPAWPSLFPSLIPPTVEDAAPLFSSAGTTLPDFFERAEGQATLSRTSIPCDLLAQTLLRGSLPLAAQIRQELKATHTPILPRSIYLNTAIRCLRRETHPDRTLGKQECLAWLGLWHSFTPEQAAAKGSLIACNQLRRLAQAALHRHGEDVRFLSEVTMLSARKGVADEVIRHMLPYITYAIPPSTSHTLLEGLIRYVQSNGPCDVHDPNRRWYQSPAFFEKVRLWRNIHLKALMRSGQWEDAQAVYKAGLENSPQVVWARHNKERLAQHLSLVSRGQHDVAKVERQKLANGEHGHERLFKSQVSPDTSHSLPHRILKVSHLRSSQPLESLISVLGELHAMHPFPSSLVERLKARFVDDAVSRKRKRSAFAATHTATETTASFWWSAEIRRLQALGQYLEAVSLFANRFEWLGLPPQSFLSRRCRRRLEDIALAAETQPHSALPGFSLSPSVDIEKDVPSELRPQLLPSSQVIANILPSLIRLLQRHSKEAIATYHRSFCDISTSSPPGLRADAISHLPFIRAYAAHATSVELAEHVQSLEKQGIPVGHQGWGVVTVALAKDGQVSRLHRLLKQLARADMSLNTNSSAFDNGSLRRLVPRTYLGPAITLLRKKNPSKARTVLRAMRQRFPIPE